MTKIHHDVYMLLHFLPYSDLISIAQIVLKNCLAFAMILIHDSRCLVTIVRGSCVIDTFVVNFETLQRLFVTSSLLSKLYAFALLFILGSKRNRSVYRFALSICESRLFEYCHHQFTAVDIENGANSAIWRAGCT